MSFKARINVEAKDQRYTTISLMMSCKVLKLDTHFTLRLCHMFLMSKFTYVLLSLNIYNYASDRLDWQNTRLDNSVLTRNMIINATSQ